MTENVHIYIYIIQILELCNFHNLANESSGFFNLVTYNETTNFKYQAIIIKLNSENKSRYRDIKLKR